MESQAASEGGEPSGAPQVATPCCRMTGREEPAEEGSILPGRVYVADSFLHDRVMFTGNVNNGTRLL